MAQAEPAERDGVRHHQQRKPHCGRPTHCGRPAAQPVGAGRRHQLAGRSIPSGRHSELLAVGYGRQRQGPLRGVGHLLPAGRHHRGLAIRAFHATGQRRRAGEQGAENRQQHLAHAPGRPADYLEQRRVRHGAANAAHDSDCAGVSPRRLLLRAPRPAGQLRGGKPFGRRYPQQTEVCPQPRPHHALRGAGAAERPTPAHQRGRRLHF